MYDALQKAGKPSELILIDKGQHWLLNEAARTQFLTALEAFLEKNLRPQAD
jgi:dipeptidyl aminopeptidase/acylaminoacyl peptidase